MIWIIGGTKDSRDILEKVADKTDESIVVTTATEYGGKLIEEYIEKNKGRITAISERLNEAQMKELITEKHINLVIDASHPYARNVSESVIAVTDEMNVRYVRFERKMLDYGTENVEKFSSLEEIVNFFKKNSGKNILSTLGSNNLGSIKEISGNNNLYVRILPTTDSIRKAEELGYLPAKIIAIQGPVDKNLNLALLKSYKIDYLITKESGETGGEKEKVEACRENGTAVIVLTRPYIDYRIVYNDVEALVNGEFSIQK